MEAGGVFFKLKIKKGKKCEQKKITNAFKLERSNHAGATDGEAYRIILHGLGEEREEREGAR